MVANTGGTLGITSTYAVNDEAVTRQRIDADLSVLLANRTKLAGMKENCIQQLDWGADRYAKMPPEPELLPVTDLPPRPWRWGTLGRLVLTVGAAIVMAFAFVVGVIILLLPVALGLDLFGKKATAHAMEETAVYYAFWIGALIPVCVFLFGTGKQTLAYYRVKTANGHRPAENARRRTLHSEACEAAMAVAKREKAAQDHRLRTQIVELERRIATLDRALADVRAISSVG